MFDDDLRRRAGQRAGGVERPRHGGISIRRIEDDQIEYLPAEQRDGVRQSCADDNRFRVRAGAQERQIRLDESDGADIALGNSLAYKGMMLSGVPNFALTVGYTNASWTLKSDLVARYVCRLINHMAGQGYATATPHPPVGTEATVPLVDLKSGYVQRSIDKLPKQGPAAPWRLHQNYPRDVLLMRYGPVDDDMRFDRAPAPVLSGQKG